jgi:hypothetical protein
VRRLVSGGDEKHIEEVKPHSGLEMNKGIRASIKGTRIDRPKSRAERERAWKQVETAMDALAAQAKRNGLTPKKLRQILREFDQERKAKRLAR